MTFNPGIWTPIAGILSVANVAAVWFAARAAEPWHALLHGALGLLFGLWAQNMAANRPTG